MVYSHGVIRASLVYKLINHCVLSQDAVCNEIAPFRLRRYKNGYENT